MDLSISASIFRQSLYFFASYVRLAFWAISLNDLSLPFNVLASTSQIPTMFPPTVKACEESLSPFPPTPMQATLIRSFAPRTRPTNGKGIDAAPAASVDRRRNARRLRTFLFCLFSIVISLLSPSIKAQGLGFVSCGGDGVQARRMQQSCSSRIKQIICWKFTI